MEVCYDHIRPGGKSLLGRIALQKSMGEMFHRGHLLYDLEDPLLRACQIEMYMTMIHTGLLLHPVGHLCIYDLYLF